MYENAQEIFDYLPNYPSYLKPYIDHLWGAFESIAEKEYPVQSFAILPFHLLFMLTIQYKVYRISAYDLNEYLKILSNSHLRNKGYEKILKENPPIPNEFGIVLATSSVRNLSLFPEKKLFEFLRIINVSQNVIAKSQELVEIRSRYAHANGNIEEELEVKIEKYIDVLRSIQPKMLVMNDIVANSWLKRMKSGQEGIDFIDTHMDEEYLCPADMQQGKLSKLDSRLNNEI